MHRPRIEIGIATGRNCIRLRSPGEARFFPAQNPFGSVLLFQQNLLNTTLNTDKKILWQK